MLHNTNEEESMTLEGSHVTNITIDMKFDSIYGQIVELQWCTV